MANATKTEVAKPTMPVTKTAQPEEVQTIQDEQLERSAEIEAMGVDAWKAAHSTGPTGGTGATGAR